MNKKISIIIPNWNGKKFLDTCLESLYKQTYKDFDIIIVDNGSEDGSVEFIKNNFPNIKVLSFSCNKGFAAAVNYGIREADGDYVFLLNNDTEIDEQCLKALTNAADKSEASIFACKMLDFFNRKIISDAGDCYSIYGYATQRGNCQIDGGQFDKHEYIFSACAGAALYKKELFQKIGYFDEDFFAYLEDIDLGFRSQLAGYVCEFIPEAKVFHIEGGTSRNLNDFSFGYSLRNNLFVLAKNMPLGLLFLFSPFILSYQIRNLIISLENRKFKIFIKSYQEFFFSFLGLLKKRREFRSSIKVSDKYILKILYKKYPYKAIKNIIKFLFFRGKLKVAVKKYKSVLFR
jgi:GT2 family glycosyltransferase